MVSASKLTSTCELKARLKDGKAVMGIWSILPSSSIVEIFGLGGLDFVILDMEHGVYDLGSLENCIRSLEGVGCAPLVRVPGLNASAVQWALDLGAHGTVVPQVAGLDEVQKAVRITKFPPIGSRGFNPFTRAGGYSPLSPTGGNRLSNDFGISAVIVENEESLSDLEQICLVETLDVIYIGVYDLSVSLGLEGNTLHPKIIQIIEESVKVITDSGKAAGLMCRNSGEIERALALGYTFLVYGVDSLLIHSAVTDVVESFENLVGKKNDS